MTRTRHSSQDIYRSLAISSSIGACSTRLPSVPLLFWHDRTEGFTVRMLLSKRNPAEDPIILWLQGGPGASSMYGLMIQWGTKVITCGADKLVNNPFPLNEKATVIFLDNPAGVGFSKGANVDNSLDSALNILRFLDQLRRTDFNGHKFSNQPLHIMGASFAGHYILALGYTIATDSKYKDLNVKSLIMGNPGLDKRREVEQIYDTICDADRTPNRYWLLDGQQCHNWLAAIRKCQSAIDLCRKERSFCSQATENECNMCSPQLYAMVREECFTIFQRYTMLLGLLRHDEVTMHNR